MACNVRFTTYESPIWIKMKPSKGLPESMQPRQAKALALRESGQTYFAIGRELGVSYQRAQQLVAAALKHR